MSERGPAPAETEIDERRRVVAAVSAFALLTACLFLSALAVFGVSDVSRFESDPARDRDPYAFATFFVMAAASAGLFGAGLAWYAATLQKVHPWRLVVAAAVITALILYVAAHSPADLTDFEMS